MIIALGKDEIEGYYTRAGSSSGGGFLTPSSVKP
jgi:hypothetical protein